MRTSHFLLRNKRHRASMMPARMKTNGNFSDASLERFYSVSINRVTSLRNDYKSNIIGPGDFVVLGRPCNSLFEFQVVHRYVIISVANCHILMPNFKNLACFGGGWHK